MATDFTRGWSVEAAKRIFKNLEASYNGDLEARDKMHDAATIAGMAYSNAFLGIGHSIAHTVGSKFNIPSGLSDAIVMPQVIRFNAQKPRKLAMWPHYSEYRAKHDYAELARMLGLGGKTEDESVDNLIQRIIELAHNLNIKVSFKDNGVSEQEFKDNVDQLAVQAYSDQNTVTNPVSPFISQIKQLMEDCYVGKGIK
jgi:acetaldehyde dehydrogenase/alcohol dehydrogenase